MATFEPLKLPNRSSHPFSKLAHRLSDDEFGHTDVGICCSPCSFPCDTTAPECHDELIPHASNLQLRSTRCDSNSTSYQNGQITPISPRLSVAKTDQTPFPPSLPNVWSWSPENTSGLASLPPTRSEVGPSNWYGSTLQSPQEVLKWERRHSVLSQPLLSPIKFNVDIEQLSADQNGQLPHPDSFDEDEFYSACDDVESYHSSDWDLVAPSRRLSYGEPLEVMKQISSRLASELPLAPMRKSSLADDVKCDTWIDDTLKAQAIRSYNSEPSRRKPRLWLDLVEDDEEVTEARATAVTTSPSKPRVISIPPRRMEVDLSRGKLQSQAASKVPSGVSTRLPETPPQSPTIPMETPDRVGCLPRVHSMDITGMSKQVRQQHAFNRIRSRTTWSASPFSPIDAPVWKFDTDERDAQHIVIAPPKVVRQATPPPTTTPLNPDIKLSELTTWIITELEKALAGNVSRTLSLDHPVIQQLRLPPKQRKAPRTSALVPARSTFSGLQGPLSSHTLPSNFATAPPDLISGRASLAVNSDLPAPTPDDETYAILDRIFPLAPRPIISTLMAEILAHQFVLTIHQQPPLASQPSPYTARRDSNSSSSLQSSPIPAAAAHASNHLPDHIPAKARAMLGLPSLRSPARPKDGRPPLPGYWRKMEKMEWKERVGELEGGLRRAVLGTIRELVGGDEWKSGERWLQALVNAVDEAVSYGETKAALALK